MMLMTVMVIMMMMWRLWCDYDAGADGAGEAVAEGDGDCDDGECCC